MIQDFVIDSRSSNITFKGFPSDVLRMTDMITKELQVIEQRKRQEAEEELLLRSVQWYHLEECGEKHHWAQFQSTINKVR